jgi:surfactin synthase thioesterase subunit
MLLIIESRSWLFSNRASTTLADLSQAKGEKEVKLGQAVGLLGVSLGGVLNEKVWNLLKLF